MSGLDDQRAAWRAALQAEDVPADQVVGALALAERIASALDAKDWGAVERGPGFGDLTRGLATIAAAVAWRELIAQTRTLLDERVAPRLRLLGPARMVLDRAAHLLGEHPGQPGAEAADMAQQIADWIGTPSPTSQRGRPCPVSQRPTLVKPAGVAVPAWPGWSPGTRQASCMARPSSSRTPERQG